MPLLQRFNHEYQHTVACEIYGISTKPGIFLSGCTGIDLSLLPPCRDALRIHIKRANYQALIWHQVDQAVPCIPQLDGHGWDTEHKKLESKWTEGDLLPQELVEVLVDESEQTPKEGEKARIVTLTDIVFDTDD